MTTGTRPRRWLLAAGDLLVVVGVASLVVTAAGLGWSRLRAGAVRPTYVREAQFVAGLLVLLAWTLRNWRGRPGGLGGPAGGTAGDGGSTPGAGSASGGSGRPGRHLGGLPVGRLGTDAYLLALGLLLLGLSLGGEVLAAG